MRAVDLSHPAVGGDRTKIARLVRHLRARMEDFGPNGPQVMEADEAYGRVSVRFPGHDTKAVLARLDRECSVTAAQQGDTAVFYLKEGTIFEDLDYLWGSLFDILE